MRILMAFGVLVAVTATGCSGCLDENEKGFGVGENHTSPPKPLSSALRMSQFRRFADAAAGGDDAQAPAQVP